MNEIEITSPWDGGKRVILPLNDVPNAITPFRCDRCAFGVKRTENDESNEFSCSIGKCWYNCDGFVEGCKMEPCGKCSHRYTYPTGNDACMVNGEIKNGKCDRFKDESDARSPFGVPPAYIGVEKRIGELADAIRRHAGEARNYPGHIRLWAREILAQVELMEQVQKWEKE